MKFWNGSGSADPYLWLMDPDPAIIVNDLQDVNKKIFWCISFWRYIYIISQRYKVIKKSENSRNQCFSCYFCLMIEESGSVSLTNGSGCGSGSPKIIWILRIRIRIRNTAIPCCRYGSVAGRIRNNSTVPALDPDPAVPFLKEICVSFVNFSSKWSTLENSKLLCLPN